jgi:hypothetical protein
VFEPETVEERLVITPPDVLTSNGHRRGKAWEAFEAACRDAGKIPVTEGKLAVARMIARSAKRTLSGLLVPDAIHEQPLLWTERVVWQETVHEVECKGKPDYMVCLPERRIGVMIDLKTCGGNVSDFRFSIQKYRYWMQAAHYRAGFKAVYGFLPRFYFAAVSKRAPFHCRLIQLDDESERKADEWRAERLTEFVRRTVEADWSDPIHEAIETVSVNVE